MMSQSSTKWSFWNAILFLCGVIVLIGVSTFLAILLLQHFRDPTQLWAAISTVFTLFGALLALAAAVALVSLAVSYLSLNGKLQQAQVYLAQARLHLDEYNQLSHQKNEIERKVHDLLRLYDGLPEQPHVSEVNHIKSLIKQVLTSEAADFEARLLARAVQQDWQAKQAFNAASTQENETAWQQAAQQWQQAGVLWQMVLAAVPEFLQLGQQKHFLATQLNQALALKNAAAFNGTDRQPEFYRRLHDLYLPLLLTEKSKDGELNQMIHYAAHQSGIQAYQEGEVLWQQGSQNLAEVRQKWFYAQQYFQKALEMNENNVESAYQWGNLLEREARLVAQSDSQKLPEARQLWLAAREKYRMALDVDEQRTEAAFNWGNTLTDEATALVQTSTEHLAEARILWQSAREKFAQALDITPEFDAAAHNAGMTFNKEADAVLQINQNADEARSLWKQAGEHFQAALEINKNRFETANSWGLVLAKEADLLVQLDEANVGEAQRLWQLAEQRFHRALEIEPNLQAAAANWRTILYHEISVLGDDNAAKRDLLLVAREKVAALALVSPQHEQSVLVQELADFIQKKINELENVNVLQPPVAQFRPVTSAD